MRDLIKTFLGVALTVAVSFLIGMGYGRKTAKVPVRLEVICDTTEVVRHDTLIRERPVYRVAYVRDTVRTHFTTIEHDTVEVDVPMERRVYAEDSLYRAVVSGWRPSLDTLIVWPKTTTITIREKTAGNAPRWGFGVAAGATVLSTPKGSVHAGLGVTAGVTYRF